MGQNVTDVQTILNFEKNYPDKLITCANEDVDPDIKISLVCNLEENENEAYMVFYDEKGLIESIYQLDFTSPYTDFIDNMGQNYNLEYIHPDIKEAFTEEVKNYYNDENMRYYAKPFKSLLAKDNEIILNEVEKLLKANIKTFEDDNSCMENLFCSLNNLKESFKDVVKKMNDVKGSDCLYDDLYYPFESVDGRETLEEISNKMTKWVDSITETNKEAGNIKQ